MKFSRLIFSHLVNSCGNFSHIQLIRQPLTNLLNSRTNFPQTYKNHEATPHRLTRLMRQCFKHFTQPIRQHQHFRNSEGNSSKLPKSWSNFSHTYPTHEATPHIYSVHEATPHIYPTHETTPHIYLTHETTPYTYSTHEETPHTYSINETNSHTPN